MSKDLINAYLQQARAVIGDRTRGEIDYDNAVVANLCAGMDIRRAIAAANKQFPDEALQAGPEHWDDLAIRYDYIKEHNAMAKRLGIKE